jgi:hypothetical protein
MDKYDISIKKLPVFFVITSKYFLFLGYLVKFIAKTFLGLYHHLHFTLPHTDTEYTSKKKGI